MEITSEERKKLIDRINYAIDFTLERELHDTVYLFNLILDKKKCTWKMIFYFLEMIDMILLERNMDEIIYINSRLYLNDTIDENLNLVTLSEQEFDKVISEHIDLDSFRVYFDILKIQREYGEKVGKIPGLINKEINYLFPEIDKNKYKVIFRHIPESDNRYMDQSIYLTKIHTIKMFE